eukprot:m.18309 g.18309  ORF g.18309 m.18309 type:complete len:117 (-) comp8291_c0_seq1:790-1140(-)
MVSLNVSLNFDDDDCEEASPLIGLSTPSRSLPIVISTAVGCLTMCGLEAVVFVPTFPFHFYLLDDTHAPWSFLCLLHGDIQKRNNELKCAGYKSDFIPQCSFNFFVFFFQCLFGWC